MPVTLPLTDYMPVCQQSMVMGAYVYAELAVSSLAVAETITSTHCAYPWGDGQAK